jgi:hypothetical protein
MPQPASFLLEHLLALDAAVREAGSIPDSPLNTAGPALLNRYAAEIDHEFARQRRPDPAVSLDLFASLLATVKASRRYDGARSAGSLDAEQWEQAVLAVAMPYRLDLDTLRHRAEETWQSWQQLQHEQHPPRCCTYWPAAPAVPPPPRPVFSPPPPTRSPPSSPATSPPVNSPPPANTRLPYARS